MTIVKVEYNVSLKYFSTMRLVGSASMVVTVRNKREIIEACDLAAKNNQTVVMIGGGSNIFWQDSGFDGLLLLNKIKGFKIQKDGDGARITIGAGENWDEAVNRMVKKGFTGVEALSLIPGTVGGTPVQNVGAYGQEISQTLVNVEAWDNKAKEFVTINGKDCDFSYRSSRFKFGPDRGRFFISAITLKLAKGSPQPPFYPSVQNYFDELGIKSPSSSDLRQAVIQIRQAKLPDPKIVANNGSFFGNPIISLDQFENLKSHYPDIPNWPVEPGYVKLAAAWLMEQAGFKNYRDSATGMATWPTQPLVLVNENANSTADLLNFKQQIVDTVFQKFKVKLTQEPELLP
jgi:UDP-N-acetylmuramate dehydrogenase